MKLPLAWTFAALLLLFAPSAEAQNLVPSRFSIHDELEVMDPSAPGLWRTERLGQILSRKEQQEVSRELVEAASDRNWVRGYQVVAVFVRLRARPAFLVMIFAEKAATLGRPHLEQVLQARGNSIPEAIRHARGPNAALSTHLVR